MPRTPRRVVTDSDQKAAYHVISRTEWGGFPFGKVEKDELVRLIKRLSTGYAVDVLGYAIMGNHVSRSGTGPDALRILGSSAPGLLLKQPMNPSRLAFKPQARRPPKAVKGLDGMYSPQRLTEVRKIWIENQRFTIRSLKSRG